ncbi:hypothetical protein BaRGS_00020512 [Batillaria attramentaria]|uniref:EF-hand domain-containing protein n=1 Tax=Batillaria attramentaria TaxID=370345 RepID=A0ABD0KLW0_9CAEN
MQASRADRDQNGNISENEFLQSILFFADNDVRDRRVTLAEFIDGYRREYKLPAELIVIMFDILDDLNNDGGGGMGRDDFRDNRNNKFFDMFFQFGKGDNVFRNTARNKGDNLLTQRDFSYRDFVGSSGRNRVEDYRKALMMWVAEAANRLYTINYQPHIPGNPWDREFDYERWFHNVDRNNDSLVSFNELKDEFRRYSRDGRVARARWAERNMNVYSDREWLANVVFDYWDKNRDLTLDDIDIGLVLREADRNRDMRVTTIEFHRFMEKYNKRARRRLATPIRPVMYDCPSPWWQSFGCRPRVDATRAAMDMDDNFDGWITHGELRKRLSYYDRNGDGWASRFEVMTFETLRYGVKGPVASLMFDIYDRNGDGRYDHGDLQFMLTARVPRQANVGKEETGVSCVFCDARRAVLDLVRLAEMFRFLPQAQVRPSRMRHGSCPAPSVRVLPYLVHSTYRLYHGGVVTPFRGGELFADLPFLAPPAGYFTEPSCSSCPNFSDCFPYAPPPLQMNLTDLFQPGLPPPSPPPTFTVSPEPSVNQGTDDERYVVCYSDYSASSQTVSEN